MNEWGKYIIMIGIAIVIVGVVFYFLGNKFEWLGHLPGDIRIEKENFKFYFPITTLLAISLILNLIIYIIRQIW